MPTDRRTFILAAAASVAAAQTDPQKKIRMPIIGTGHRAWAHIQVLKALPIK
jgi:ornithine cyclodeaminase/alanine dehydrogenase-like protein (mu-crystallin family)